METMIEQDKRRDKYISVIRHLRIVRSAPIPRSWHPTKPINTTPSSHRTPHVALSHCLAAVLQLGQRSVVLVHVSVASPGGELVALDLPPARSEVLLQMEDLPGCHERIGEPSLSRPRSPAHPMDVRAHIDLHVILDDAAHAGNVHASPHRINRDEHVDTAAFQALAQFLPSIRSLLAMEMGRPDARELIQQPVQADCAVFRVREAEDVRGFRATDLVDDEDDPAVLFVVHHEVFFQSFRCGVILRDIALGLWAADHEELGIVQVEMFKEMRLPRQCS